MEATEAITDAPAEIDGGGLLEILRRKDEGSKLIGDKRDY